MCVILTSLCQGKQNWLQRDYSSKWLFLQQWFSLCSCWRWCKTETWEVSEGRKHMSGCLHRQQPPCSGTGKSSDLTWTSQWASLFLKVLFLGIQYLKAVRDNIHQTRLFWLRKSQVCRVQGEPRCPQGLVMMDVEGPGHSWDQIHLSPMRLGASGRREAPVSTDLQLHLQTTAPPSQQISSWTFRLDLLIGEVIFSLTLSLSSAASLLHKEDYNSWNA